MEQRTDAELVREVLKGTRAAFTEIMRRYQQRVYWTARRIVGRHEDAEDIAQETFVKAYLALEDFRGESSLFTWLYRIAVNLSLNSLRKRQVMKYLSQSELLMRLLPATESPEQAVYEKETSSLINKAIATLPERQRAVFVLRYFDETPYEEISKILGTSVGGLKANYFHALRKVQEFLKNETTI